MPRASRPATRLTPRSWSATRTSSSSTVGGDASGCVPQLCSVPPIRPTRRSWHGADDVRTLVCQADQGRGLREDRPGPDARPQRRPVPGRGSVAPGGVAPTCGARPPNRRAGLAVRRRRRHGRRGRRRAREPDGDRDDLPADGAGVGDRAGINGPAVRLPSEGSRGGRERANSRVCGGAPRSPRDGNHDYRRGRAGRSLLPVAGRRQPRLPDPQRAGGAAHQGPVADAAPGRGGRADRGGSGPERATQYHSPGAGARRSRQGRSHAPGSPQGGHPGVVLRRTDGHGEKGGDRRRRDPRAGPAGGVRQADRARQRAGRAGQHHRRAGTLRRRGAAPARAERRDRPPGVPTHRYRDQHGAGPGLPREPGARARGAEPPARDRVARHRGRRPGALPGQPGPVSAQFKFLSGARVGQVETFRKAYIGLGRHPLSDVRCDAERDLDVSSRHAGIVRHNDTFVLRDLGSTNGTFVNGAPISGDVVLADGHVIGLGQNGPAVEFRILPGEPAVDTVPDGVRASAELAAAGTSGNAAAIARLRAALDAAETRQRGLAGAVVMDYRTISLKNQDAVALLVVQLSDSEIFSGTAFAADSQGTLVTNRHILVGEDGTRQPRRIAIKFSGSRQWFPGRLVGVADSADVAVVKVEIRGGTPRVAGFAGEPRALARGDPVAIIGYPLGEDLPMERFGETGVIADPTLTVGTVSKALANVVQVDGYGAPGSSGSPIFDRTGCVAAVLYGGNRESQGKIIYAVPASQIVAFLTQLGTTR